MITAQGCKTRRERLLSGTTSDLLLADPLHLRYFANFYVDPFSLGADFGGLLLIRKDGSTLLVHDNRLPKSVSQAHVDEILKIDWYDGKGSASGSRRAVLQSFLKRSGIGLPHDDLSHLGAEELWETTSRMRRSKDPDEIEQLRQCMRITEVGHAWAREHVEPGMTELDVYKGIFSACCLAAGHPVIVYGDFAVSPGLARRGGMATMQTLKEGDTLILDFSVVLQGYRSDFTNTLVVGKNPTKEQQKLFDTCLEAMRAGEALLRPEMDSDEVYRGVRRVFEAAGLAEQFPHHAGHGLGLSHPESPFFVEYGTDRLVPGDVVTLEPGLYVEGIGGVRIEHNYLVTDTGFQQLSQHHLGLV